MAEIRVHNLLKRFGAFIAVKGVSLTVADGDFFVLLGPSGCGKTTTLRMIAGLEIPTEGEIRVGGEDVTFRRAAQRDIAFVFQLFALYPHMNVRDNLLFPLKAQGVARRERQARLAEVARLLRIDQILRRPVGGLSSGDRQRVALGRAIIRRPKAFLMDEPLGALDTEFRELMAEELRALHDRIAATTVYVTHDQTEAMAMATRIAVMDRGNVLQVGTPAEIYERPATRFVAGFVGTPVMNFLPVRLPVAAGTRRVVIDGAEVTVRPLREVPARGETVLGVRPEHVALADDGPLRGQIYGLEYMGARQIVTVETAAGHVKVRVPAGERLRIGENVGLRPDPSRAHLFDAATERALVMGNADG
ncbi:MAG TPA: ABC transporter ATP-binding protein [Alphaproteobacteria bacterium]|nr:ABC transporter ATP-binding protein [Alphaproteobacteria bacterium]